MLLAGLALAGLTGRAAAAPRREAVDAARLVRAGDPVLGNPDGDLTIVDFYDIRCPPCRAMEPRLRRLLAHDRGIRYVPVDYPILGQASLLGVAALFAAQEQGAYVPLRARLLTQRRPPSRELIHADAAALGLDWPALELAMSGDRVAHRIAANLARGRALGIRGIPRMVIGSIFVPGPLHYGDLVAVVASARARQGGSRAAGRA